MTLFLTAACNNVMLNYQSKKQTISNEAVEGTIEDTKKTSSSCLSNQTWFFLSISESVDLLPTLQKRSERPLNRTRTARRSQ